MRTVSNFIRKASPRWVKHGEWRNLFIATTTAALVMMNIIIWLIGIACIAYWLSQRFLA
jgi:hypothetical protein